MTPQERAHRIMLIAADGFSMDWNIHGVEIMAKITAQIEEAERDAFEEAAKIAETPYTRDETEYFEEGPCYPCDCHDVCPQKLIPKKIRQRAKELEG